MAFLLSLLIAILPALSAATRLGGRHYGLSPRQTVTCNFAITASNGDTCDSIAASWGLTLDDFKTLNPGVNCPTLVVGQRYCVLGSVSTAPPTTSTATSTAISSRSTTSPPTATSTTTRAPTTTTTSSNVHEPTQPGLAPNCNNFYFVKTGDTCDRIIARYGISFAQFYSWNPAVGEQCTTMWADAWVCVGVAGATTTPPTPTPTSPPAGPQPQMPGIAPNCKRYYFVQSGDTCEVVQRAQGVTLAQIRAWNTMVNEECTNLWLGYYICVGV